MQDCLGCLLFSFVYSLLQFFKAMRLRRSTSLSDLKGAGAGFEDTMFPEGLELVHPRYAIERRNGWMLKRSDYFVTYVHHG